MHRLHFLSSTPLLFQVVCINRLRGIVPSGPEMYSDLRILARLLALVA